MAIGSLCGEGVHAAPSDLWGALRGGNVMRVRKIIGDKLVFTNEDRAMISVFLFPHQTGEVKTASTYPS